MKSEPMSTYPTLLAIESSCDDTSAAVIVNGEVKSNVTANQEAHRIYGGVVPELASRAHQQHIVPVVDAALKKAGVDRKDLDGIAFTRGPGLIGSLLVGVSFAKGMALTLDVPMVAVNHMQAHVLAHFIDPPRPTFPFLCLTVSGGHTQIVLVKDYMDMEVVGETIDDAAGEAFDKTAKMLQLPYPGGPIIDKLAKLGNPKAFKFPEPKAHRPLDFSFSGLKTSVLYKLRKKKLEDPNFVTDNINDICASVQATIVRILIKRLTKAAELYNINQVSIAGGVSANSELRQKVKEAGEKHNWQVYIPQFQYCTDNAGMIAMAAHHQFLAGDFVDQTVTPLPRWSVSG